MQKQHPHSHILPLLPNSERLRQPSVAVGVGACARVGTGAPAERPRQNGDRGELEEEEEDEEELRELRELIFDFRVEALAVRGGITLLKLMEAMVGR